jgi:hypothetical protein
MSVHWRRRLPPRPHPAHLPRSFQPGSRQAFPGKKACIGSPRQLPIPPALRFCMPRHLQHAESSKSRLRVPLDLRQPAFSVDPLHPPTQPTASVWPQRPIRPSVPGPPPPRCCGRASGTPRTPVQLASPVYPALQPGLTSRACRLLRKFGIFVKLL